MTVNELITILKRQPENTPVLVDGYEDGYENIISVNAISVVQNTKALWYNGEYEKAEKDSNNTVKAVILSRNRRSQ